MSRKVPPPIPVVGAGGGSGDSSREDQIREWEEAQRKQREQQAAAAVPQPAPAAAAVPVQASAPPVVDTPVVALPDPGADPGDQLAQCEQHIHSAKARWTATVQGATEAFIAEAGPYLAWVHEHKLYKLMKGNDGRTYRSFAKYLKEQHDLPRRTGYRITQTIPLLNVLAGIGHQLPDLSARQVDALHPVRTQHGTDAVARVWTAAWATKKGPLPTPEELEKAKQLLGLTTKPETDEEPTELVSGAVDPGAAMERAAKLLVPETVREAVRKDPDRVRVLHRVLGEALAEAGVPLE